MVLSGSYKYQGELRNNIERTRGQKLGSFRHRGAKLNLRRIITIEYTLFNEKMGVKLHTINAE